MTYIDLLNCLYNQFEDHTIFMYNASYFLSK